MFPKEMWESEVQRANRLIAVIRGEDEVRECNVPLALSFWTYLEIMQNNAIEEISLN